MTLFDVAANQPTERNECSGPTSATTGNWASTVYSSNQGVRYGFLVYIPNYAGPGSYGDRARVQLWSNNRTHVWETQPTSTVAVSIDSDQLQGTVDATLVNLTDGPGSVHLSGTWRCG